VAAGGQLTTERDRREGVPGVAEGGEKEAQWRAGSGSALAQTSSARAWTMRLRSSLSNDIGVVMIVPTPASR